jgi:hypothetical protein
MSWTSPRGKSVSKKLLNDTKDVEKRKDVILNGLR